MDLTATCLAAANVMPDTEYPLDGRDLLPVLTGQAPVSERTLYWRMANRNQRAVRRGDWKYLKVTDQEFLFDIGYDPRERGEDAFAFASFTSDKARSRLVRNDSFSRRSPATARFFSITNGMVNIQLPNGEKGIVKLFDHAGKELKSFNISANTSLDLSSYEKGMLFMEVIVNGKVELKKIELN
jgi:hypothetical protein